MADAIRNWNGMCCDGTIAEFEFSTTAMLTVLVVILMLVSKPTSIRYAEFKPR